MAICKFNVDNFTYNIESNLEAMGLPVPKTIFGSVTPLSVDEFDINGVLPFLDMISSFFNR